MRGVDGAPPHFEILTAMQNGVGRRRSSTTVAEQLSKPGLRHPRLWLGRPVATTKVAKADASDEATTYVLEIVGMPQASVIGSNGVSRIVSIPTPANNDD